jgi:hypothetical protein
MASHPASPRIKGKIGEHQQWKNVPVIFFHDKNQTKLSFYLLVLQDKLCLNAI